MDWSAVERTVRWVRRSRAGIYRWWAEWRGAPWGGQLSRQTEPRWKLQMAGGVERSAVRWAVRWADAAVLGSTDGGRTGVEWSAMVWTVRWADGAALGSTEGGRSGEERRGVGS